MWSELLGFWSASEKGWAFLLWCWCEGQRSGSEGQVQCGTAQGTLQAFPQVLVQAGTATENESLALAAFCTSTLCHPKCSVQPKHKAGRLTLPQITCSKSCLQDQSLKEQCVFFFKFYQSKYWCNVPLTCSEVVILTWCGWGGSHHLLVLSGWSSSFCCLMFLLQVSVKLSSYTFFCSASISLIFISSLILS